MSVNITADPCLETGMTPTTAFNATELTPYARNKGLEEFNFGVAPSEKFAA